MRAYVSYLSFVAVFSMLLFPVHVGAQIDSGFFTNINPEISFDPAFPGPNEEVVASLSTHSFNQFGASIRWFVDGTEVPEVKNQTSLPLTTGNIGETKRVQAFISGDDINTTVERVLVSRDVDIILESDSIVPAFYEGRALPSAGNTITAVALPQLGENTDPRSLFYTWSVGSTILFGGPQQGMNRATIPPERNPERTLTVTVSSAQGEQLVKKVVRLSSIEPVLHMYINNELRGVLPIAVKTAVLVPGEEVGLYAVPYYMSRNIENTESAQHQWFVDRSSVNNPSSDPFSIILRREEAGTATLRFSLQSLEDFLQSVSREISIIFE